MLQGALDSACSLTGARYGVITLLDESGRIQDFVTSGLTPADHRRFVELPDGLIFFEYLSRITEPLRLKDFRRHTRALGLPEFRPPKAVSPKGELRQFPYTGSAIEELIRRPGGRNVALIVIESAGGVERRPLAALAAAELPVTLINPRQIHDFARASGRLAKTDAIDAAAIAHFGEALKPPIRPLPEPKTEELATLT